MKIKLTTAVCLFVFCVPRVCGQPDGLRNQYFRIDTLHYYKQRIFLQRIDDRDLNIYMEGNAPVNKMAWALMDMQNNLERMKQCVVDNKPIDKLNLTIVQRCIDAISTIDHGYDLTRYVEEYRFYLSYVPAADVASTDGDASKAGEGSQTGVDNNVRAGRGKTAWEQDRAVLLAEDPNVVTPYDEALVMGYAANFWHEENDPARMAWEKIQYVKYHKNKRAADSARAALEHYQSTKHEKFLKDFAAQRKKNFTKAFGAGIAAKLLARKVWIGMSMAMVDSMFLWPDDEKRTTTREGTTIAWFFKGRLGDDPIRPDLDTWLVFDADTKQLIAIEK